MIRNDFELQTIAKDHFTMDNCQVYIPSIEGDNQETFWLKDEEEDDCSSNSSLCFSSFSPQKENIPETLTTK